LVGESVELRANTPFAPEHIGPTVTGEVATGRGFTVTFVVATAALQGPAGSLVVKVNVAVPVNPRGGVHVAFKAFGLEKVPPELVVHVALEAAPPMVPFRIKGWFIQTPFG